MKIVKFDNRIIESDIFMELTLGAKLIYFSYMYYADKEGYVKHFKRIYQCEKCAIGDIKNLIENGLILIQNDTLRIARTYSELFNTDDVVG